MNNELPVSPYILRKIIAYKAYDILNKKDRPEPVPTEFYDIAEMAIAEAYANVQKMVTDTIRQRLEKMI